MGWDGVVAAAEATEIADAARTTLFGLPFMLL